MTDEQITARYPAARTAVGHPRKLHSRIGCVEDGCTCAVTYMDL